jgi:septum formation protein
MYFDKVILASQSPRRLEIMKDYGFDPAVMPVSADETLPADIKMEDAVLFLALKKALAAEHQILEQSPELCGCLIVAADTIVYKDGIMGKPADKDDARRMITAIRNTTHFVASGVALIVAGESRRRAFCEVTEVTCSDYPDSDIEAYIATDEPYDKAGGYAIQGTFGKYITHIAGDYDNVVGLPCIRMLSEIDRL